MGICTGRRFIFGGERSALATPIQLRDERGKRHGLHQGGRVFQYSYQMPMTADRKLQLQQIWKEKINPNSARFTGSMGTGVTRGNVSTNVETPSPTITPR